MDPSVARREDKHNRLMNERLLKGLSGANSIPDLPSDSPSGVSAAGGGDVTASMVKRLQQLEKDSKVKTATMQQLQMENDSLHKRIHELETELQKARSAAATPSSTSETDVLRSEVDRYRKQAKAAWRQVADLKRFLNDYGMVWVGEGDPPSSHHSSRKSPPAPPAGNNNGRNSRAGSVEAEDSHKENQGGEGAGAAVGGRGGGQASTSSSSTSNRPTWANLDVKLLQRRIDDLNASLDGDSARAQPVPVVVYRDGLQLHTWPFRPVTDASAQGILVDILDGYFPFILQGDFPEGVPLVLLDMSHLEYLKGVPPLPSARRANANPPSNNNIVSWSEVQAGGRDAGAAVTKEKYLKQLPQTVIKDGRVIEVRNEIRALLEKKGGGAHVGGLTPSQAAAEAANQRQVGEPAGMPASKPSLLDRRQSLSERPTSSGGPPAPPTGEPSTSARPRISSSGSAKLLAPLKPRASGAINELSMMDTPAIDQLLAGGRRGVAGASSKVRESSKLDWLAEAPPPQSKSSAAVRTSIDGPQSLQQRPGTAGTAVSSSLDASTMAEEAADVPMAMLQVKSFDGQQTYLLKLPATDTIGALRRKIQGLVLVQEFEIRTAFPPVAYADDSQTLQDAGLAPSATLLLRKK